METTKAKLRQFLAAYLRSHQVRDDDDIFARGLVNSLFATQLVLFVEQEFGIEIDNDDLELDNFHTIEAIARLVARKTARAPA